MRPKWLVLSESSFTRIGNYTALHIASKQGYADLGRALLATNADANAMTRTTGVVPMHLAAASRSPERY